MTPQEIEEIFTYHAPFGDQAERYENLRYRAKTLARAITDLCPNSREKSLAITLLQQSVQMANASIAIHEKPHEPHRTVTLPDGERLDCDPATDPPRVEPNTCAT